MFSPAALKRLLQLKLAISTTLEPNSRFHFTLFLCNKVTTFLNLALSLQRPEDGLDDLRTRVAPILVPASEQGCIFSELTIVLVSTREELASRFASMDTRDDHHSGDAGGAAAAAAAVDSDMFVARFLV